MREERRLFGMADWGFLFWDFFDAGRRFFFSFIDLYAKSFLAVRFLDFENSREKKG